MTPPVPTEELTPVLQKRVARLNRLNEGEENGTPLAETVRAGLTHLWETGGRLGSMASGLAPESIYVREPFICDQVTKPALGELVKSSGLQLRLLLLLLFDAQCRHPMGEHVRNVRGVSRGRNDEYLAWRDLVLTDTHPTSGTGRSSGVLRARQITEALVALENKKLVTIPTTHGKRHYDRFQMLEETGSSGDAPAYTGPDSGVAIPRNFFTNLWVFALTDTEIAAYLALLYMRKAHLGYHEQVGVFLTAEHREKYFGLTRTTWRSVDLLHRYRLIDRMPSTGRSFRSGKVGQFPERWANREVLPVRHKIVDKALDRLAIPAIRQVLTAPTDLDKQRLEIGQAAIDANQNLELPTL